MSRWLSPRALLAGLFLIVLPLSCGIVVLAGHAQRDWSLHWTSPTTIIASTSSSDYAAVTTPQGWDIAWTDPSDQLVLSRFNRSGQRREGDLHLSGNPSSTPQSLTLGRTGGTDVVAWRQDTSNGSTLRAAVVPAGGTPRYFTLAAGVAPLEHPSAFTAGRNVDIVFSWQRPSFNVYLARVPADGAPLPLRALTQSTTYAYSPHAVVQPDGAVRLLYMNQCCASSAFNVLTRRFSPAGTPLGPTQQLGQITSIAGQGQGASPDRWGIDLAQDGARTWGAWSGDQGLAIAAWDGARTAVTPRVLVPGTLVQSMALDVVGDHRELVWRQPFQLGTYLGTIQFDRNGLPGGAPDRVAFESAGVDSPTSLRVGAVPFVLWQAHPAKTTVTRIELGRFSATTRQAPSIWARLGFGLANPVGSFAVLIVGSFLFGVVLTVANIMLIFGCVVLFALVFRRVEAPWKWYAYGAALTLVLYATFVLWGAPSPPVLFLAGLSGAAGVVTVLGAVCFLLVLLRSFLTRMDDLYKAGALAFAALYFVAFLQALMIIQDQIGTT